MKEVQLKSVGILQKILLILSGLVALTLLFYVAGPKMGVFAIGGLMIFLIILRAPKIGLYFMLFAGTCFQVFGSRDMTGLPVNLAQVFAGLTAVSWIVYLIQTRKTLSYSPQLPAFGLFFLMLVLSLAIQPDKGWSIFGIVRFIELFLFYYLIACFGGEEKGFLIKYCMAFSLVIAIAGIISMIEYFMPQLAVSSVDPTVKMGAIGAYIESDTLETAESIKRITGGMLHANWLGYAAACVLPLNLYWWKYHTSALSRLAILGCAGLQLFALIFSYTRSALVGFGVAILYIIAKRRLPFFWSIAVMVVAFIVLLLVLPASFTERTFSLKFAKGGSTPTRVALIDGAVELFKEKPVFGYGYKQFGKELMKRYLSDPENRLDPNLETFKYKIGLGVDREEDISTHSMILELLVEYGLIGLVMFVLFLVLVFRDLWISEKLGDRQMSDLSVFMCAGFLCFCTCSFFGHIKELRILWIMAGISVAIRRIVMTARSSQILDDMD